MTTLAVLTKPWQKRATTPPEHWPLGRAALALASQGIDIIFTGQIRSGIATGQRARPGAWHPGVAQVDAAWDRFPSQTLPAAWQELLDGLGPALLGNPPELILLCRDKVRSQQQLEAAGVRMPELEHRAEHLESALARWGGGFAKPRHGALGRGVRRVQPGTPLPSHCEGAVAGEHDQLILQRAVALWGGYGGISVRALVQRTPEGRWWCCPPVVRAHPTDPVANVARGAHVTAAIDLFGPQTTDALRALATQAAIALGNDPRAVELGVDLVVDEHGLPWVIEINGVPRGHLAALAKLDPARWAQAHLEACCRPLLRLAALLNSGVPLSHP